jgi:hypothetical protein
MKSRATRRSVPSKAREKLGRQARITLTELVREMVSEGLDDALRTDVLRKAGFVVLEPRE